jgi:hypothetical protein
MPNRKLKLKADVLRHLSDQQTRRVAGGTTDYDTCGQNTCSPCGSAIFFGCGSQGTCYGSCQGTCNASCGPDPSICISQCEGDTCLGC